MRRACVIASLLAATVISANAATAGAEVKTHTLFMGLDLSVEYKESFHRVKDVEGSSFVIAANNEPVFLPVNRSSHNLRVSHALKLASNSATVTNLMSQRAYTPANEPRMLRMREQMAATAAVQDASSLAMGKFVASQTNLGIVPGDPNALGVDVRGGADAGASRRMAALEADSLPEMLSQLDDLASDQTNTGLSRSRAEDDLAQELFDAIETKFELSSETPLNNPYLLLVARFRGPREPPSSARNWIYAKSLDPIDSRPLDVHILRGGFPRGFILEDFQVHLYNRGEEVATNHSPKRVALTREEAFEYLKIQYVGARKGATLPPAPAMGQLPADLHQRLSGGQYHRTYFVKVSKDGFAEGAYVDDKCEERLEDDYLQSVVKNIRFKPALEKGKPVDGIAAVNLEKLPL